MVTIHYQVCNPQSNTIMVINWATRPLTSPPLHLGVRPSVFVASISLLSLRVFFHPRRWWIASQTVSSTLTRAYHLQFDSTIVHGAYGVVVRCNISSTASRY